MISTNTTEADWYDFWHCEDKDDKKDKKEDKPYVPFHHPV